MIFGFPSPYVSWLSLCRYSQTTICSVRGIFAKPQAAQIFTFFVMLLWSVCVSIGNQALSTQLVSTHFRCRQSITTHFWLYGSIHSVCQLENLSHPIFHLHEKLPVREILNFIIITQVCNIYRTVLNFRHMKSVVQYSQHFRIVYYNIRFTLTSRINLVSASCCNTYVQFRWHFENGY